jgi:glycerophosphoryl diester phosphodiesterase
MRYLLLLIFAFTSCQPNQNNMITKTFDIEGHRGCRGLMPENTIPAFLKAMDLKVNTLEMDLAITADKQVIVSHEPYFRAGISMDPNGIPITKEDQLNHNMYQMTYDSIKKYDVGTLPDSNHPDRANVAAYRPLFSEVVRTVKEYCTQHDRGLPDFNIEIKREPQYDNLYHPAVEEFVDLVLAQVDQLGISDQTIIQSFDLESLQITKQKSPNLRLALLIENEDSPQVNVEKLGFIPEIYSCYFKLIDQSLMDYCKINNIAVIPWTVNKNEDIKAMIDMGVDGIISDYPNRVIEILGRDAAH